jgi:undecaprenyl-diphosphatase
MPDWIAVIILGILEGVTEFIPISSTGHLLIAERCLIAAKWLSKGPGDLFNVVIQCGAVLAVLPLFSVRCQQLIFRWRDVETRGYLLKMTLAFGITGVIGFVLEKKGFRLREDLSPVAWALLVGGILFLVVEHWLRGKPLRDEVTWSIAVAVGFGQLVAMIFPGASRSGSTILFALALGLSRPAATEFSFLVGIPTMLAAGGLKIFKALHHAGEAHVAGAVPENWGRVILGTLVAAVVSFAAVKWFLRYVQTHTFEGFGWYRIAVGIAILVWIR